MAEIISVSVLNADSVPERPRVSFLTNPPPGRMSLLGTQPDHYGRGYGMGLLAALPAV